MVINEQTEFQKFLDKIMNYFFFMVLGNIAYLATTKVFNNITLDIEYYLMYIVVLSMFYIIDSAFTKKERVKAYRHITGKRYNKYKKDNN